MQTESHRRKQKEGGREAESENLDAIRVDSLEVVECLRLDCQNEQSQSESQSHAASYFGQSRFGQRLVPMLPIIRFHTRERETACVCLYDSA